MHFVALVRWIFGVYGGTEETHQFSALRWQTLFTA
jgi:hypothetical protein